MHGGVAKIPDFLLQKIPFSLVIAVTLSIIVEVEVQRSLSVFAVDFSCELVLVL